MTKDKILKTLSQIEEETHSLKYSSFAEYIQAMRAKAERGTLPLCAEGLFLLPKLRQHLTILQIRKADCKKLALLIDDLQNLCLKGLQFYEK